jgi:hypothetical protein
MKKLLPSAQNIINFWIELYRLNPFVILITTADIVLLLNLSEYIFRHWNRDIADFYTIFSIIIKCYLIVFIPYYLLTYKDKFGYIFTILFFSSQAFFSANSVYVTYGTYRWFLLLGSSDSDSTNLLNFNFTVGILKLILSIIVVGLSSYYLFWYIKREKRVKGMSETELVKDFFLNVRLSDDFSHMSGEKNLKKAKEFNRRSVWDLYELKRRKSHFADLVEKSLKYDDLAVTEAARNEIAEVLGDEVLEPLNNDWKISEENRN